MIADTDYDQSGHDDYYGSMADILAGLLFIFIIIAMIFAVVQRYIDADALESVAQREQATVARMAELDARESRLALQEQDLAERESRVAEAAERAFEFERTVQVERMLEARARLVEAMAAELSSRGLSVQSDPAQGVIGLSSGNIYTVGAVGLSPAGTKSVSGLAEVLRKYLPCVAQAPNGPRGTIGGTINCAPYADARLAALQVVATADPTGIAGARAVTLLGGMLDGSPGLIELRNDHEQRLLDVRVVDGQPVTPQKPAKGKKSARPDLRDTGRIDLHLPLSLPSAGPGQSVLPGSAKGGN
jgi:chemotaxis protein MotB